MALTMDETLQRTEFTRPSFVKQYGIPVRYGGSKRVIMEDDEECDADVEDLLLNKERGISSLPDGCVKGFDDWLNLSLPVTELQALQPRAVQRTMVVNEDSLKEEVLR